MARIDLPEGDGLDIFKAFALRPDLAAGANAYDQAVWNSTLDWRLHELVRMRVAQINQCTVCLAYRRDDSGVPEDVLAQVGGWAASDAFSPAEKAALSFTEQFCGDSAAISDDLMTDLQGLLPPGHVVELALVVGKYLAMGRFMQVLGLDQTCDLQSALATTASD